MVLREIQELVLSHGLLRSMLSPFKFQLTVCTVQAKSTYVTFRLTFEIERRIVLAPSAKQRDNNVTTKHVRNAAIYQQTWPSTIEVITSEALRALLHTAPRKIQHGTGITAYSRLLNSVPILTFSQCTYSDRLWHGCSCSRKNSSIKPEWYDQREVMRTCSKRFDTSRCAFSISSNKTIWKGLRRTASKTSKRESIQ